mmetsp:Transcript_12358/g.33895  ORF Transcript_12358/g.33895 Transcript_12358/m.33895 type:complete len:271 (+) Transcript_12358:299-1111(+)
MLLLEYTVSLDGTRTAGAESMDMPRKPPAASGDLRARRPNVPEEEGTGVRGALRGPRFDTACVDAPDDILGASEPTCCAAAAGAPAFGTDSRELTRELWRKDPLLLSGGGTACNCACGANPCDCRPAIAMRSACSRPTRGLPRPSSSTSTVAAVSGSPGSKSSGFESCDRDARGAKEPNALSAHEGDWLRVERSIAPWSFSQCASAKRPNEPSTAALVRCFNSRNICWTSFISASCLVAPCCIAATYVTIVFRWPVFSTFVCSTFRMLLS